MNKLLVDKLERWVLYPFFFGAYPILALLAHNVDQVALLFALRSILFAVIVTALFLALFRVLLRDWSKAALATTLVHALFFSYGHVYDLIEDALLFGINVGRHRTLLVIWAGLFTFGLGLIARRRGEIKVWNQALNVVGIVALIFPLTQIGLYQGKAISSSTTEQITRVESADELGLHLSEGETPPDIYYIILDTYTRGDTLAKRFKFDNSIYLNELEQRGFYIADCSQSNYASTSLSLASSLNFSYLGALSEELALPNKTIADVYPFIKNNATHHLLNDLGYQIVAFESGYHPTELYNANTYLSPQADVGAALFVSGINLFEAALLRSSAGLLIYEIRPHLPGRVKTFLDDAYVVHRNRMLYALNELENVHSMPGPKFVFVHLLAPHNPFVFGPNGEELERETPFTLNADQEAQNLTDYIAGFRDQITYLNTRTLDLIDVILANSATSPIIIIQGDHGPPRSTFADWRMTILNAYYLPEGGSQFLYESISPVNSFRVIFNHYFGGNLELLDDTNCFSYTDDPYLCSVIQDPNPACSSDE